MEILTVELAREWCRLDANVDTSTLEMLESAAIDIIEHELNRPLRPYDDAETGAVVTPIITQSIKHAIALYIGAHYDNRDGAVDQAMRTIRALVAPTRVVSL